MEKSTSEKIGPTIHFESSCLHILERIRENQLHVSFQRYRIPIDTTAATWTIASLFSVKIYFLICSKNVGNSMHSIWISSEDSEVSNEEALWCAGGILTMIGLTAVLSNHINVIAIHNGSKIRIAISSIFYRKALRLSQTALGETAPGKMVNLLSNDANRFVLASAYINFMWTAPLTTICVAILLNREIGYPAMTGIAMIGIVVPIQSECSSPVTKCIRKILLAQHHDHLCFFRLHGQIVF